MTPRSVGIIGTGIYVPETIRTNDWFTQSKLGSLGAIFEETGIQERRICAPGELPSDMEAKGLLAAVENAKISVKDIDMILDAPFMPDQPQPGNASILQHKVGAVHAAMNQYLETVVVCPLTSSLHPMWKSRIQMECAGNPSEIAVDQIRTISKQRLKKKIDTLSSAISAQLRLTITAMYAE